MVRTTTGVCGSRSRRRRRRNGAAGLAVLGVAGESICDCRQCPTSVSRLFLCFVVQLLVRVIRSNYDPLASSYSIVEDSSRLSPIHSLGFIIARWAQQSRSSPTIMRFGCLRLLHFPPREQTTNGIYMCHSLDPDDRYSCRQLGCWNPLLSHWGASLGTHYIQHLATVWRATCYL